MDRGQNEKKINLKKNFCHQASIPVDKGFEEIVFAVGENIIFPQMYCHELDQKNNSCEFNGANLSFLSTKRENFLTI